MKVAMFTNAYLPMTNGVAQSVALLKRGLEKLGCDVLVVAPDHDGVVNNHDPNVCRVPSIDLYGEQVNYPVPVPFAARLYWLARWLDSDFDVVHSHHPFGLGAEGAWIASQQGGPSIFTYHTRYEEYIHYVPLGETVSKLIIRHAVARHIGRCDCVIVPTHAMAEMAGDVIGEKHTEILPSPVAEVFYRADARDRRPPVAEELRLIYVGRLAMEKNVQLLIRCLKHVVEAAPQCQLTLIGDGPERQTLQRLAQTLGLADHVSFVGSVPQDKVSEYLAVTDVFVFGSRTETQGMVLAEAMATGLPIVAVRDPVVEEIVHDGIEGYLSEDDERAFADAIIRLSTHPDEWKRLSENASRRSQDYKLDAIADKLAKIYQATCSRAKGEFKVQHGSPFAY